MVIRGIGTDFAKTERIFQLFQKYPNGFLKKALHTTEIAHFNNLNKTNLQKQQQYLATWYIIFPLQCCVGFAWLTEKPMVIRDDFLKQLYK